MIKGCVVSTFAIIVMVSGERALYGQDYPNKPIRILAAEPGGSSDFVARLIAQGLTGALGQQVIVDNRAAQIAIETVAKARADGYTLLYQSGALWIGPLIQNLPFDPVRDFSPISLINMAPNILVVHPSLPVRSVKELIALARLRPGELNYASSGTGTAPHLAGELFKSMGGVNIVRITYRVTGLAINDMISGQVQVSFYTPTSVMPHVKSGKLRALAVTSAQPSALVPDLPTVAASGLPGYETVNMFGMFAPAGTPVSIINGLNQEIVRFLSRVDVKEKFFNVGSETIGSSPERLAAAMKSEMARLGKVIKDAGIRAD